MATGNADPTIAMNRGRSRGLVTLAMMVCDISWSPAELNPWAMRAPTSHSMLGANPQTAEETMNSSSETRNTRRGPTTSPSLPSTGSITVAASVYPTMIQLICSSAPNPPPIVAIEVETMV